SSRPHKHDEIERADVTGAVPSPRRLSHPRHGLRHRRERISGPHPPAPRSKNTRRRADMRTARRGRQKPHLLGVAEPAVAVEVSGLTKTYPGDVLAVKGIDFTVAAGEAFGLLGPNGAGKSTT